MKISRIWWSLCLLFSVGCSTSIKNSYSGHGAESIRSEIIEKYAPTPISSELSRKIQNYLDVRSPNAGLLTPNHKQMFFTWKVTGVNQVWKINGPNEFPIQMTGGEDQTVLSGMTRDGKYLILSRDRNGEENPGIYLQSVDGGPLIKVQHQSKIQTFFETQSLDGKTLFFRANDKDPKSFAIYRYNIEKNVKELVFSEPGTWEVLDIKNDSQLLLSKEFSNIKNEVYELDLMTNKLSPVFGQSENSEFRAVYGSKDNEYFVISPRGSDFRILYHVIHNQWNQISPKINFDASSISIDKSRTHVFYEINEAGYTRLKSFDAKTLKEIETPKFTNADHVRLSRQSEDGQFATLAVVTAKAPQTNYVWDLKMNKVTKWVSSSAPEVQIDNFVASTLENYIARDGTSIPMFVRRPKNCQKGNESHCAVIVHFHGGPESQTQPGFSITGQLFVESGFIYVEPNVRGSDGYGQKWLNSDNGPKRLNVITDIEDASRYLKEKWGVKKIGVMGGSYGGYSTLYAMTKFAGSYDAGVEIVGMSNLVTFLMNTAPYRRALRIPEYGDPEKDREALVELSPITHLNNIKAPLMMIQGANDPRVPVGEALQFNDALEKKSIPHELVIFADEGHGAAKRGNQVIQIGKTIEFFTKYLKL